MGRIVEILNTLEQVAVVFKKSISSKTFQTFFAFAVVSFSILGSTTVFGQPTFDPNEEVKIDWNICYEEVDMNKRGAGWTEYSVMDNQGNQLCAVLSQTLASLEPELLPENRAGFADYEDKYITQKRTGVIGSVNSLNAEMLYNHPRVDVVAHLANEWVPGYDTGYTSIYAQDGTGYGLLQSIKIVDIWDNVRMISYALFVVVLIAAGFMIMFRQKIGGQMMVTVFNTIPKVIVGLFLVTFSFAIVGIIIDIGAVLIRISAVILEVGDNPLVVTNPFSLLSVLLRGETGLSFSPELASGLGVFSVGGIIAGLASTAALATVAGIGGIFVIILGLIVIGIITFASVKVFITLFKAYLGIVIDTILAPLYLTVAVIPGKQSVGLDWLNRVFKNVFTFVGVFFVINLSVYLYNNEVDLSFPAGLAGGDLSTGGNWGILNFLIRHLLPIVLFFIAAEVPNFLSDFLPTGGGKGAAAGMQGVQKSLGKIPVLGSIFG